MFNGELYFSANGNDGSGYELWKFNGTATTRVSDINKSGDSFPSFLTAYNKKLKVQRGGKTYYFCAPGCKKAFLQNPEKYLRPSK